VTIELSGGLEILFDKVSRHEVEIKESKGDKMSLKELILWMRDHLIKERPDLFVQDESVRPGILVLINDCDWELLGGLEAEVSNGDTVVFISTLHGG